MTGIDKTIGRLVAVLVSAGIVKGEQAVWILEPVNDKSENAVQGMGEMSIDEAIERYKINAEFERTHDNLQGCLQFRQLAKWLKQLQDVKKIVSEHDLDTMPEDYWYINRIRRVVQDAE